MPSDKKPTGGSSLRQGNVRYHARELIEAKEAAEWEGVGVSDYFRSALRARLRETHIKRAEHERRLRGDKRADG